MRAIANIVDVESPWLTHDALKKYLGNASDEWVKQHVWTDQFVKVKKVGKKYFYIKSQIDRFIDKHSYI